MEDWLFLCLQITKKTNKQQRLTPSFVVICFVFASDRRGVFVTYVVSSIVIIIFNYSFSQCYKVHLKLVSSLSQTYRSPFV